jgi:hypothetical protein
MAQPVTFNSLQDFGNAFSASPPTLTLGQSQATPENSITHTDPISAALPLTTPVAQKLQQNLQQASKSFANSITGGVGAPPDDAAKPTTQASQSAVDAVTNGNINDSFGAQPNILDNYYSYSYNISFYIMPTGSASNVIVNGQLNMPPNTLLFQSGGQSPTLRNKYFQNDFYIDKLTIQTNMAGKGTGSANASTEFEMTVIEPIGMTLIPNLSAAVQSVLGTSAKTGFQSCLYLIVIDFMGYDEHGNIVMCGSGSGNNSTVVKKYFPVTLNEVHWKINNKQVEYTLKMVPTNQTIATGTARGTIMYNTELSADTVQDALLGGSSPNSTATTDGREATSSSGPNKGSTTTAPANVSSSQGAGVANRPGLLTNMNNWQKKLVQDGIYTYPDTYKVVFKDPKIAQAKITVSDGTYKGTGMQDNGTASQDVDPNKQAVSTNTRQVSFTAGQQVLQAIEQIVRNSSYVNNQSNTSFDEKTGKQLKNTASGPNNSPQWFTVTTQALPGQYDPKRNDYAYNITYFIAPYKISQINSQYFNAPTFNGIHKDYAYTFTGENTEVLSYEQSMNNQYQITMSGSADQATSLQTNYSLKQNFSPASGQTTQGASGKTNEAAANAADYLYNPTDYQKVEIRIVGDPAWIGQGAEVGQPPDTTPGFLPDGTININASEVRFRITVGTPTDYNLQTGIMDPNTPNNTYQVNSQFNGVTVRSYVFKAPTVTSVFDRGQFTQTIIGQTSSDDTYLQQQNQLSGVTNTISNIANGGIPGIRNVTNAANSPQTPQVSSSSPQGTSENTGAPNLNQNNANPVYASAPTPPTSNGDVVTLPDGRVANIVSVQTYPHEIDPIDAALNSLNPGYLTPEMASMPDFQTGQIAGQPSRGNPQVMNREA